MDSYFSVQGSPLTPLARGWHQRERFLIYAHQTFPYAIDCYFYCPPSQISESQNSGREDGVSKDSEGIFLIWGVDGCCLSSAPLFSCPRYIMSLTKMLVALGVWEGVNIYDHYNGVVSRYLPIAPIMTASFFPIAYLNHCIGISHFPLVFIRSLSPPYSQKWWHLSSPV